MKMNNGTPGARKRRAAEEVDRLCAALDSAADAIFLADPETFRFIDVNATACARLGYSRDELLQLSLHDINFDPEKAGAHYRAILAGVGKTGIVESFHQHRNGSIFPVEVGVSMGESGGKPRIVAIARDISERIRARQALRESEQFNRTILNTATDGFIVVDRQGRFLDINPAYCRLIGYTREELLGMSLRDIEAAEMPEQATFHIERIMAAGSDIFETVHRHQDGTLVPVEVSVNCLVGNNRFFSFVRDITGRKRAEENLRKSKMQLSLLIEQAPVSIAMLDSKLRYLATSQRWVGEYGRGHTNLPGMHHYEVHPDVSDEWKRVHREALAGAFLKNDEDLWIQGDGSRHWLRWAVYPWTDENGRIGGIIISAEDITSLKLAEEKLLERVLEVLPVGVRISDREGNIVKGNPAGRMIWQDALDVGIERCGEYRGWRHGTGEPVAPEEWGLARAVRKGETVLNEIIDIECFDGSRKTILNSGIPLHDDAGNIIGAIAVDQDITESLRMEDALRDSEADLNRAQAVGQIGSWKLDIRHGVLTWSDESYRIFGIPRDTPLTYEAFLSSVHPDDRGYVDREWKNALQGAPYDIEHRIVVGGEARWIRERAELQWDGDGQLVGGIGTCQDITERKCIELEQRRLAKMQAAILDALPANIALIDDAGTVLAVNRQWMQYAGENGEGVGKAGVGSNYLAACDDARGRNARDAVAIAAGIRNVVRGGCGRYSREYAFPVGGQRKWHRMVAVPFAADAGAGAVIMHLDITESRLAEERLHVREEEFRALAENAPDIIARFDRQYRHLYVNPAIEAATGLPVAAFIGKTHAEVGMPEDLVAGCQAAIREVFSRGSEHAAEFTLATPQGEKHYHCRMVPERNRRGVVDTVLAVARDITDSKVAELELSASRQLLRELAAENETAREEERKHVAREVHDELGQILTALRMDASLLRMRFGADEPALAQKIRDMMALVDRAIQGVRDVAARLRPAVLDMGVISALEWLSGEFTRHTGTPCKLRVPEENIELDEARKVAIFRIVQESLTNVIRHAEAGCVEIIIGWRGGDLWVEVRDNGRGFDPAMHRAGKSFGLLGMRERAIALGGNVDIISAPGQGVVVSVLIPIDPVMLLSGT